MNVNLLKDSTAHDCYQAEETTENYYCDFGMNPEFIDKLNHEDLKISGIDQDGEIRILELKKNRFFISTLFVPQTNSTEDLPHPLIEKFVLESLK